MPLRTPYAPGVANVAGYEHGLCARHEDCVSASKSDVLRNDSGLEGLQVDANHVAIVF